MLTSLLLNTSCTMVHVTVATVPTTSSPLDHDETLCLQYQRTLSSLIREPLNVAIILQSMGQTTTHTVTQCPISTYPYLVSSRMISTPTFSLRGSLSL